MNDTARKLLEIWSDGRIKAAEVEAEQLHKKLGVLAARVEELREAERVLQACIADRVHKNMVAVAVELAKVRADLARQRGRHEKLQADLASLRDDVARWRNLRTGVVP